ncbi:MAG: L-fuconate dehydratase [Planctomycetes bacterium]|nr:L-fuconate dehydratase [Planctomycetota bacterium]
MPITITGVIIHDVRFPTSKGLDGSDAMNPDPDYSAAYVELTTDRPGLTGHGLTFTIGRGNEICCAAIQALTYLVVGRTLEEFIAAPGAFWRRLVGDSQLRWIGPEKGAIHLATAALVNALWDAYARVEGKPLWRLLCAMTPEQLVACIDFRYITDALTPDEALTMLRANLATRPQRIAELERVGYPAYTTSAGWLGYPDDKLRRLCREALAAGFVHLKIKVGRDVDDDIRRCRIIREEIGWTNTLAVDANQVWDVGQAIAWMQKLVPYKPLWIEEPTSPDDVLGHAAIAAALRPLGIGVATGEHCQNRVMFKQLLQAKAIDFCQIDSCRLGGVNEILAVYLMAAKFGVPVCPHAGGVGLCEYVQHLSMWDYVSVSASFTGRVIEFVNHLAAEIENPVSIRDSRYWPPSAPGYGAVFKPAALAAYTFPGGSAWSKAATA